MKRASVVALVLLVMLVCGVFLCGCGDGDNKLTFPRVLQFSVRMTNGAAIDTHLYVSPSETAGAGNRVAPSEGRTATFSHEFASESDSFTYVVTAFRDGVVLDTLSVEKLGSTSDTSDSFSFTGGALTQN